MAIGIKFGGPGGFGSGRAGGPKFGGFGGPKGFVGGILPGFGGGPDRGKGPDRKEGGLANLGERIKERVQERLGLDDKDDKKEAKEAPKVIVVREGNVGGQQQALQQQPPPPAAPPQPVQAAAPPPQNPNATGPILAPSVLGQQPPRPDPTKIIDANVLNSLRAGDSAAFIGSLAGNVQQSLDSAAIQFFRLTS